MRNYKFRQMNNIGNRIFGTLGAWLIALLIIGIVNTARDPDPVITWSFKALVVLSASWGTKAIWEL